MYNLGNYVPYTLEVLESDAIAGSYNKVAVGIDAIAGGEGVVFIGFQEDVELKRARGRRKTRVNNRIYIARADLDTLKFF